MLGPGFFSDLLGWTSIGCWLFAQFPQVLENVRRQSCEGLALPFLSNWLLGDITNLIGCVLTHQLPFQTILASYFVWVDFMLFSQYFYYRAKALPKGGEMPQPESSPNERFGSRRRSYSTDIDRHHYRELSTAAANLAIAAAMAASEEEAVQRAKSPTSTSARDPRQSRPAHRRSSTSITRSEAEEAEDEVDEDALAALADSFHSEGGRKRLSWSHERGMSSNRQHRSIRSSVSPFTSMRTPLHVDTTHEQVISDAAGSRGRARQRQVIDSPIDATNLEGQEAHHSPSLTRPTRDRKNSRVSQRSLSLVFLGVWAFFTFGSFQDPILGHAAPLLPRGSVISSTPISPQAIVNVSADHSISALEDNEPSSEQIIGRMFAWLCTTLYLTSRLPQIWKNFRRKSVEGLSMYLFVFAFLGNLFYVTSILTSPMMSESFFLESIPYLLGSGGTLLFDVTIVIQSFIYRSPPQLSRKLHSRTNSYAVNKPAIRVPPSVEEEGRPLLNSDLEYGQHSDETLRQEHLDAQARRRREISTSEDEYPPH